MMVRTYGRRKGGGIPRTYSDTELNDAVHDDDDVGSDPFGFSLSQPQESSDPFNFPVPGVWRDEEHVDEVNFAGLRKGQPVQIRRASLLSLMFICGTAQQMRLLRTQISKLDKLRKKL